MIFLKESTSLKLCGVLIIIPFSVVEARSFGPGHILADKSPVQIEVDSGTRQGGGV